MKKSKFQESHVYIDFWKLLTILGLIIAIGFAIYTWVNSSLSSLEKSFDNNLKNISEKMTTIQEQTKDISNIRADVHAMLYNERKTQGEAVKTSSPQLASTLNSDALARSSLEQHMASTEFNQVLGILKAKPLTEAKTALKEKNLFNDSQIKTIFDSEKKSD